MTGSDLIRREDIVYYTQLEPMGNGQYEDVEVAYRNDIEALPSASGEQTDCTDFVNWLLEEVMYEEMWELNAVANGEIIARKLKKLGLLEVKDGYYVRTPSEKNIARDIAAILANEQDMRVLLHADRQNGEWIPCSERLPDESEFVLITIDIGTVTEDGTAMVEQVLTAHYSSADGEENLFQTIGYGNVFLSKEVTAWMPLPKPYREDGEKGARMNDSCMPRR